MSASSARRRVRRARSITRQVSITHDIPFQSYEKRTREGYRVRRRLARATRDLRHQRGFGV